MQNVVELLTTFHSVENATTFDMLHIGLFNVGSFSSYV